MTATTLRTYTAKDLAQMARENGVAGWHSMRKEELIRVLVRMAQRRSVKNGNARGPINVNGMNKLRVAVAHSSAKSGISSRPAVDSAARRKISQLQHKLAEIRNIASRSASG